jgi:hypothetical protein
MTSGIRRSKCGINRRFHIGVRTMARNGRCVLLEVDTSALSLDVGWALPRLGVMLAAGIGIGVGTAGLQLVDSGSCPLGRVVCGQEVTRITRMCVDKGDSLGGWWPRVGRGHRQVRCSC